MMINASMNLYNASNALVPSVNMNTRIDAIIERLVKPAKFMDSLSKKEIDILQKRH